MHEMPSCRVSLGSISSSDSEKDERISANAARPADVAVRAASLDT